MHRRRAGPRRRLRAGLTISRLARPDAPRARDIADDVRSGRLDPRAVVEDALARIDAVDGELGAFVLVDADGARAQAQALRDRAMSGYDGPLAGVPVGVKDLYDVAGQETRAGSAVPPGPPARADAPAVARLRAAGAVVIGRTRTHEFAWGGTTQHPSLGGTANPWDLTRVPGGSSGGSAAAVAAGLVPAALGTDTGCSIRLPAAWCGIVGHKPSAGLVPLDGVVPLAPSLDHGGALTVDVADARLLLEVLADIGLRGPESLRERRIGVPDVGGRAAAAVADALEATVGRAIEAGLRPTPVTPPLDGLVALYADISLREAVAAHRDRGTWPRDAEFYGEPLRQALVRAGRLDPDPTLAPRRAGLREQTAQLFAGVDVVLLPVAAGGPSSRAHAEELDVDGVTMTPREAALPWTVWADLAGLPACSVPVGLDPDGLPIGLQVVGPAGADALVLTVAEALAVALG